MTTDDLDHLRALSERWQRERTPRGTCHDVPARTLAESVPALLALIDAKDAEIARLAEILEARRELEDAIWDILKARLERENPNFINVMTVDEFRVFDRWIHLEAELLPQESEDDDGQ